jgi:hypothetical protein
MIGGYTKESIMEDEGIELKECDNCHELFTFLTKVPRLPWIFTLDEYHYLCYDCHVLYIKGDENGLKVKRIKWWNGKK